VTETPKYAWEREQWCWEVPQMLIRLNGTQVHTRRRLSCLGFTGFTPSREGLCIIRPPNLRWRRHMVTPSKIEILRDGTVCFVIDTAECLPTITQVKSLR